MVPHGILAAQARLTVYLMLDLDSQADRLASLGDHRRGRGCLYIKRLSDIDMGVLEDLIRASCGGSR